MRFVSLPVCAFGCALALLGACKTTRSSDDEAPKPWQVEILRGAQHIGTDRVASWPPPLGTCLETQFTVNDLPVDDTTGKPASQVLLAFRHSGEPLGSIEINGTQVFSRVTALDRFTSAIGDLIANVTVCAIESAFPGDPDCDPVEVPIKTTFVGRRISAGMLVLGTNSARVCATAGDFLLADGLRLTEASSQTDRLPWPPFSRGGDARGCRTVEHQDPSIEYGRNAGHSGTPLLRLARRLLVG